MQLNPCPIRNNAWELLYDQAYALLLDKQVENLKLAEKFGKVGNKEKATEYYNLVNDLHYLVFYSTLYAYKAADIINQGKSYKAKDLMDEFKIDCMRKRFACMGIDIQEILNIFGITENGDGGISVMRIDDGPVIFTPRPIDE